MLEGLLVSLSPINILYNVLGVALGIITGAIPGLSAPMAIALLIPLTYTLDTTSAIILMTAIYCGATYGGSISAILVNIPGTSAAAATCLDGYPLAKKGQASKALGTAVLCSAIGGLFSSVVLLVGAPLLAKFALAFGPAEYFALALLGLSAITSLGAKNQVKSLLSAFLGLLIATVGMDAITGQGRFTFGKMFLMDGINYIPALIGLFAVTEVFGMLAPREGAVEKVKGGSGTKLPSFKEMWPMRWVIAKSTLIGTWVGILPGEGATVASFMSYAEAVRSSKTPEKFGAGMLEGIAAAESANNAAVGGSYVPTLALGIPGSATAAVLLGALTIHGINAGPLMFINQSTLAYGVIFAIFYANLLFLLAGIFFTKFFVKFLDMPYDILGALIILFSVIGTFALRNNTGDLWFMLGFGVLGLVLRESAIPVAPMILGLVLGPIAEVNFRRAALLHGSVGDALSGSAITIILILLSALILFSPTIKCLREKMKDKRDGAVGGGLPSHES